MRIKSWSESLKGRDHGEDLRVDGRIILKWILEKWCVRVCTGLGPMTDSCEHCNEPSCSIKDGEFIVHISGYYILKRDPLHGVSEPVSQSVSQSVCLSVCVFGQLPDSWFKFHPPTCAPHLSLTTFQTIKLIGRWMVL